MPADASSPPELTTPIDPGSITTKQEFGDALTRLRERAGLTVRDVASAAGLPASTVGGYLSGRHLPPIGQPDLLASIVRVCGVTDPAALAQWRQALARVRRLPGPRPAGAPAPYRGLASFQAADAEWFFGRRAPTRTVVEALADRWRAGAGPVMVVGPSGSGKSSLLRAGVVPAVRDGGLGIPGSQDWPVLLLTPGTRPVTALAEQLATVLGAPTSEIIDDLSENPGNCATRARDAGGLVIVVDQFEEVFTECRDEDQRHSFLAALLAASSSTGTSPDAGAVPAAAVLLGLRADFYHRALREPTLVPALQRSQVALGPMGEDELREAIVGPARKARLDVEEGLVELLLRDLAPTHTTADAAHEAGALPLLSHALRATWERSSRGRLTVADYQATGGIRGGVACTADAVYASLTGAEQELARRLFIRLVRVGDDAPNTRRRVVRGELDQLLHELAPRRTSPAEGPAQDLLARALDRFVDERLITVDADTVEITHEALVVAWPRLRAWVEADRRGLLIGQQLDDASRQWEREHRDPALLYRGTRLAAAREWADGGGHRELTAPGREFLHASVRRERRRVRVLHQTVAALAALLLLAVTGGVLAVHQRTAANQERNLALSRMVAVRADRLAETDPALAAQLALAAYRIAPTVEARSSLLSASARPAVTRLLGPDALMQDLTFHAGRRLLAAASDDDRSVLLWDVADPHRPQLLTSALPGLSGVINTVAFRPDGQVLAVGGTDQSVYLYDLADPARPVDLGARLSGGRDTLHAVAFSPDGTVLAAGGQDAAVRLWNVADPGAPTPLGDPLAGPGAAVTSVAFSPDGQVLVASGHGSTVHRWDVSDPGAPTVLGDPLTGPDRIVYSMSFSPDTTLLAAAGTDQNIYLWDVHGTSPEPADVFPGPSGTGWVHSVAVSPDGRSIAAGTGDGLVRLWDRASGEVTATLPHPGPVTGLVYDPDTDSLYTSAADGTVRRWTLPGPVLAAATGTVFDLMHHPHAPIVAAASGDGHIYLWDVTDPQHPALLTEPLASPDPDSALVGTLTISPDGRTLAASGRDGATWRWDITDPGNPTTIDPPLTELPTFAESLRFSPDSDLLAAGGADGTLQLWDLTDPHRPRPLATMTEGAGNVYSVAFHPDGQILAAGSVDRVAWLWDISDPGRPVALTDPLTGPTNYIYSVAFSPDGDTLVLGSADETVRFWDVTDPRSPRPGPVLTGPNGYVMWVEYRPDGLGLAAASRDHTVWQWDLTDPDHPEVYAVLSAAEGVVNMVSHHPDGHMLAASSNDTTVRLWHTRPDDVATHICAVAGDPVTRTEWEQYVPGLPYQPPC